MRLFWKIYFAVTLLAVTVACSNKKDSQKFDLSQAVILVSPEIKSLVNESAKAILTEEIGKRTGLQLKTGESWDSKTIIACALSGDQNLYGEAVPKRQGENLPETKKEGFRLVHTNANGKDILWIIGADSRGVLYGIGKLLRMAEMTANSITIPMATDLATAPEYAIRGHQFGYRQTANSWDAWTIEQFDQHFREQMLFGANSIEGIPFQDHRPDPHMKFSRDTMNVIFSKICQKYDLDYWIWAAEETDLKDEKSRKAELVKYEEFFKACPKFDAVFYPGGDPGENHPKDVLPFLEEMTAILHKYHPHATMWISLQGFDEEKVKYFYDFLNKKSPDWLTGVVNGPSSPPIKLERELLPKKYKLRSYPDVTHTVRCQFPVKKWDQAFALTEGREVCNPQPLYYAGIHNHDAPYTDGFISYSDGCHDDLDKVVWSQMAWDTKQDVRKVVNEYSNFFFSSKVANEAAEGIMDLEQNWVGPTAENTTIEKTLELWKKLEAENPQLNATNWRWQLLMMRAYYDAFIQQRNGYEKKLETEANEILVKAKNIGADKAMEEALAHLQLAEKKPVAKDLKEKALFYTDELFKTVGLQSSMKLYQAAGYERGCFRDFIDYPLNNRWWLEDEFKKVKEMKTEEEKVARLDFIRSYETPGEGSFYDNISSADAKHVTSETEDAIDYLWENDGWSRKRLSTQLFQFNPELQYTKLVPNTDYLIRVAGYGEALLRANGQLLKPTKYEKGFEQFKEFPLSKDLIKDGKLKITFDKPDEKHLNWRQQSRVTDVWLIKLQ